MAEAQDSSRRAPEPTQGRGPGDTSPAQPRESQDTPGSGWLLAELDPAPAEVPARPSRRDLRAGGRRPARGRGTADEHADPFGPVPFLWLLLGAVLIAVSLAVLWGAAQHSEERLGAEPGGGVATGPAGTEEADDPSGMLVGGTGSDDPEPDDGADAEAREALGGLAQGTDCSNLYADAQVVRTYGEAVLDDGAWPDVLSSRLLQASFDDLARSCDADYAERLARYIIDDPTAADAVVYALQDHFGMLPEARPAPADAVVDAAFRTASGNIRCTLTPDGAGCSILVRSFANPPGCTAPADGPVSVAVFGSEVVPCAGTIAGGSSRLATGGTATVGHYACTNEGASVSCWHTVSGAGFTLGPDGLTEH